MKQLEEKIKDRLKGYESNLPEGDLTEFNSLLDKSADAGTKHKTAYLWWLTPTAIAAGAALLFILRPTPGVEPIKVVDNGTLVAQTIESVTADDNTDALTVESKPSATRKSQNYHSRTVNREETRGYAENENKAEEPSVGATTSEVKGTDSNSVSGTSTNIGGSSPFIPASISDNKKTASMKVGPAAAGVLGGSGAIALACTLPSLLNDHVAYNIPESEGWNGAGDVTNEKTGNDTHYLPLRVGVSMRIPFNGRWSLTTGIDYSCYSSKIGYSISGDHKQNIHYLGIPVRADFSIARNKWLDVYVGAGASADFCIAAYEDGNKIEKDGIGFSLIGAGGVQFNFTENLGVFLDPTFSWNIPSDTMVLETYRSTHPLMFSVSIGLRATVPYKK